MKSQENDILLSEISLLFILILRIIKQTIVIFKMSVKSDLKKIRSCKVSVKFYIFSIPFTLQKWVWMRN